MSEGKSLAPRPKVVAGSTGTPTAAMLLQWAHSHGWIADPNVYDVAIIGGLMSLVFGYFMPDRKL